MIADGSNRAMDVCMLELGNAREREEAEWEELFRRSDERFKYLGVKRSKGSSLALMEAVWTG